MPFVFNESACCIITMLCCIICYCSGCWFFCYHTDNTRHNTQPSNAKIRFEIEAVFAEIYYAQTHKQTGMYARETPTINSHTQDKINGFRNFFAAFN